MNTSTQSDATSLDCEGYRKLLSAVEKDEKGCSWHDYRGKLDWVVSRARHYAEKTGLRAEDILDAWEQRRDYWYMNYYQESRQPEIEGDRVRLFETVDDLARSIGGKGFRCPHCNEVSGSPYACDSGAMVGGKPCDWKVFGLFGHKGKGAEVFVKDKLVGESIFMPVAWEKGAEEHERDS